MRENKKAVYGSIIALLGIVIGLVGNLLPDTFKNRITASFPVSFTISFETLWIIMIVLVVAILLFFIWKYEGPEKKQPSSVPPPVQPANDEKKELPVPDQPSPEYLEKLRAFKKSLYDEVDRSGFSAVPNMLKKIADCNYKYDKPAFAGLQSDAITLLSGMASNQFISRLKSFIDTIH